MTDITELAKRMRGLAEYVDDCDEAADALDVAEPVIREQADNALREENARLREALKPFAETDTDFYAGEKDYYVCTAVWFSIGQYRAARAAFKETGND